MVIFCHGNSEDLGSLPGVLVRIRDTLHAHVIGIEYSGYGISAGAPSESSINNDLLVLYSFLRGVMRWDPRHIHLFGFSIGTGPVVQLASREHVGGITLLAPYTSIRAMVLEVMPRAVGRVAQYMISNRFVNVRAITKVECPTLVVHGMSDKLIPHTHGEQLHEACGARRKKLYLAEDLDHCYTDEELEMYVLFPMLDFHGAAKPGGRRLELPPYVFVKPESPLGDPLPPRRTGSSQSDERPAGDGYAGHDEPDLARPSTPPPPWSCATCTYANEGDALRCDMCDRARPDDAAPLETEEELKEERAAERELAEHSSELDLEHYWACERCTFLNPPFAGPGRGACSVCSAPAPDGVAAVAVAAAAAAPGEDWSCARCTYVNLASAHACGVCAELRPKNDAIDPSDAELDAP